MTRETDKLLAEGLIKGFAGGTSRDTTWRGGFQLESSEYPIFDEHEEVIGEYVDQWTADRAGGGQEIARIGEERATRVYAGGTIGLEALKELGLTTSDVIRYLKEKINEFGEETRLHQNCSPDPDGDWQYTYRIMDRIEGIPLTVGMETISYRDNLVFAHGFLLTPIE